MDACNQTDRDRTEEKRVVGTNATEACPVACSDQLPASCYQL